MDKFDKGVLVVWSIMVLASLGFWAVVLWAVIKLVNHYA